MKASLLRRLSFLAVPAGLLLAIAGNAAHAQPPERFSPGKMDTFLYGAAFYEEYMPEDRLDRDVQLMQQAGIGVVRVGESTWSLWEPEDGRFEYAWMDRVVDAMGKAGIKVIMGTPTYSIPTWLYHAHPDRGARTRGRRGREQETERAGGRTRGAGPNRSGSH